MKLTVSLRLNALKVTHLREIETAANMTHYIVIPRINLEEYGLAEIVIEVAEVTPGDPSA